MIDDFLNISVVICAYTEERWHDLLAAINQFSDKLFFQVKSYSVHRP